jgi:hypothetical protein
MTDPREFLFPRQRIYLSAPKEWDDVRLLASELKVRGDWGGTRGVCERRIYRRANIWKDLTRTRRHDTRYSEVFQDVLWIARYMGWPRRSAGGETHRAIMSVPKTSNPKSRTRYQRRGHPSTLSPISPEPLETKRDRTDLYAVRWESAFAKRLRRFQFAFPLGCNSALVISLFLAPAHSGGECAKTAILLLNNSDSFLTTIWEYNRASSSLLYRKHILSEGVSTNECT